MDEFLIFHLRFRQLIICSQDILGNIVNTSNNSGYPSSKYGYSNYSSFQHHLIALFKACLIWKTGKVGQHENNYSCRNFIQEAVYTKYECTWVAFAADYIRYKVYSCCKDHCLSDSNHHAQGINIDLGLLGKQTEANWWSSL